MFAFVFIFPASQRFPDPISELNFHSWLKGSMALQFGHSRLRTSIQIEKSNGCLPPEFGDIPFDHFVAEKWNPESTLSRNEQKEQLVRRYITAGSYLRRPYIEAPSLEALTNIPSTIPTDLYTPLQRSMNQTSGSTFWIRTWYGDDQTTEAEADVQYNALGQRAFGAALAGMMDIDEHFVFSDKGRFEANTSELRAFKAPEFVSRALVECPDKIGGDSLMFNRFGRMLVHGEEETYDLEDVPDVPEVDRYQVLLVLVADRKSCVEGKVLGIGINHRGQMLPGRVRRKADEAFQMEANWDDGQPLSENFDNDLVDEEHDDHEGIDGWS